MLIAKNKKRLNLIFLCSEALALFELIKIIGFFAFPERGVHVPIRGLRVRGMVVQRRRRKKQNDNLVCFAHLDFCDFKALSAFQKLAFREFFALFTINPEYPL